MSEIRIITEKSEHHGVDEHLQHAEQLLHVRSLGFQQLVHNVPADRQRGETDRQ